MGAQGVGSTTGRDAFVFGSTDTGGSAGSVEVRKLGGGRAGGFSTSVGGGATHAGGSAGFDMSGATGGAVDATDASFIRSALEAGAAEGSFTSGFDTAAPAVGGAGTGAGSIVETQFTSEVAGGPEFAIGGSQGGFASDLMHGSSSTGMGTGGGEFAATRGEGSFMSSFSTDTSGMDGAQGAASSMATGPVTGAVETGFGTAGSEGAFSAGVRRKKMSSSRSMKALTGTADSSFQTGTGGPSGTVETGFAEGMAGGPGFTTRGGGTSFSSSFEKKSSFGAMEGAGSASGVAGMAPAKFAVGGTGRGSAVETGFGSGQSGGPAFQTTGGEGGFSTSFSSQSSTSTGDTSGGMAGMAGMGAGTGDVRVVGLTGTRTGTGAGEASTADGSTGSQFFRREGSFSSSFKSGTSGMTGADTTRTGMNFQGFSSPVGTGPGASMTKSTTLFKAGGGAGTGQMGSGFSVDMVPLTGGGTGGAGSTSSRTTTRRFKFSAGSSTGTGAGTGSGTATAGSAGVTDLSQNQLFDFLKKFQDTVNAGEVGGGSGGGVQTMTTTTKVTRTGGATGVASGKASMGGSGSMDAGSMGALQNLLRDKMKSALAGLGGGKMSVHGDQGSTVIEKTTTTTGQDGTQTTVTKTTVQGGDQPAISVQSNVLPIAKYAPPYCTLDNIRMGKLYHSHPTDPHKFIQCDTFGVAHVQPCSAQEYYGPLASVCVDGPVNTPVV